jgi:hypothetical protein
VFDPRSSASDETGTTAFEMGGLDVSRTDGQREAGAKRE